MKSVDQIVERLRNGIRRGAYAADGLLPPQKAMAKKMGLSARAVAAAYARLANEGLVRVLFVPDPSESG